MIVSVDDLKSHLRLPLDFDVDDDEIQQFGEAASAQIAAWLNRPVYATEGDLPAVDAPDYDPDQIAAPPQVITAVKMMVSRFYHWRSGEGASDVDANLPMSIRAMIAPYRIFHRVQA